jgi:hypothetical protein
VHRIRPASRPLRCGRKRLDLARALSAERITEYQRQLRLHVRTIATECRRRSVILHRGTRHERAQRGRRVNGIGRKRELSEDEKRDEH